MSGWREEIIGDARLILGDCREVLPTIGNVDAVVTSPPYGQQRDYGKPIDDWRSVVSAALCLVPDGGQTQVLVNLGLIHRDGRVVAYWDDLIADMTANGWRLFGWYVWDQGSGMAGDWNGRLAPSHEFVFHFNRVSRQPNKTKRTLGRVLNGYELRSKDGTARRKSQSGVAGQPFKISDSVIRSPREHGADIGHPARFPVRFATELVEPYTIPKQTVVDPFMGSGTTGVACANLERAFVGIEIEPTYFDIACRRIEEAYKQPRLFDEPKPKVEQGALQL